MKKTEIRMIKGSYIIGVIKNVRYHDEAEELEGELEYTGADGELHQRWTKESELEVIEK